MPLAAQLWSRGPTLDQPLITSSRSTQRLALHCRGRRLRNPSYTQVYFHTSVQTKFVLYDLCNGKMLYAIVSTNKIIKVKASCFITVPSAFTPNNDGLNDFLGPLNASALSNREFIVYNRNGQVVFSSSGINSQWDGTINRIRQPSGVYIWLLKYTDPISGKTLLQRGSTVLIR